MKNKLLNALTAVVLLLASNFTFAQAPPLGTAADYVLFTTVGGMTNVGTSHLTGNVGTNSGSITGFGNVNGVMNSQNGATGQCAADLLNAYNLLNSTIPTFFPAPLLGNGAVLNAGVYSISAAATLSSNLILNAQGDSNAVFIFQIAGPLSTNANSKVKLMNGALACNVFWKVEGLVSMAPGTYMVGTVIANNAAINMNTNDTLQGRALSTTGAVTVNGVLAYTPIGCGSPTLNGPAAVNLASTACYTIFSSDGAVTNAGVTMVTGDVGTNVGLTTGFNALDVTGNIHPIPDGSTAACAADLIGVYNYLNTLPADIELLYPAQFGHNLVLTPHTYIMNGGVTFTDTLYLNALGNSNAVFVIQVNGALSTSTFAKVVLINGAQAVNVFWKIDGAVSINDYSIFNGTIVANNGAVSINTGVQLNGRAFTTTGTLTTAAITAIAPPGCGGGGSQVTITSQPAAQTVCAGDSASFSVSATGTGLTYQWRNGNTNLTNGGNISGATSNMLMFTPVTASDASVLYNVVVTDSSAASATSINASLVVNIAPVLTCPGNQFITSAVSTVVTYSSTVTGNPAPTVTYQFTGATAGSGSGNGSGSSFNVGTTTVTLTAANTCSTVTCSFTVLVSTCTNAPASPVISGPNAICTIVHPAYTASSAGAVSYTWTSTIGMVINSGQGTSSISTTVSGNYASWTITCTATNGCGTSTATSFTVTKKPQTPSAIAGPTNICGLTSVTYSISPAFGATSYNWTIPAGMTITGGQGTTSVTVTIASTFTIGAVKVMAVNACGSIPGTTLAVYGKVAPSTLTGPTNVCGMTTATYSCNTIPNAVSYGWQVPASWTFTGQGTTTIVATMPANINNVTFSGIVRVHGINGCGNSADKTMTVSYCKSPESVMDNQQSTIEIYPNPATNQLTVKSEQLTVKEIQIYNVLGECVYKSEIVTTESTINISDLLKGMYFVRLTDADNNLVYTQRVIKQ